MNQDRRFRSELPMALLLGGLLVATVVLIEPTKSAVSNWSEIGLGFKDLLAWLALPAAIGFVALAGLAVVSLVVAPRRTVPLLAALNVALWAQGNLFVWDYGSFDGSPVDWSRHSGKGMVELAFLGAALALAATKPEWIRPRALLIAGVVLALQLAALGDRVRQHAPFPDRLPRSLATEQDRETLEAASRYSRDLNVIVVVLDSLQSDFFSKAMDHPELRDAMPPGFTFYRNALSQYVWTEFSLPSMLTSSRFTSIQYSPGWSDEMMSRSLPTRLAREGFGAILLGFTRHVPCDTERWGYKCLQNTALAAPLKANAGLREDVSDMFSLGLFRLSPHLLKPRIYDDGQFRVPQLYPVRAGREALWLSPQIYKNTRTDLAVFDQLTASAVAAERPPQFRFLHFYASHRPSTVDEHCVYPSDRRKKNVHATTRCILSRLYAFFHKLDEIGVYDQSLILVVADHGRFTGHWKGVPLFLAKPLGDRLPLRTSELPVSLCDVPSSIFDALSIEHDFECESIFSQQPDRERTRVHYRHADSPRASRGKRVDFEVFTVQGDSWLPESWSSTDLEPDPDPG